MIARDPDAVARLVGSLGDSLDAERRLLDQLQGVLREQRRGVAEDDIEAVDDSVHAAHRVMQTIAEARRHRQSVVQALTGEGDLPLSSLRDALGARMTPSLEGRWLELESMARNVSREVSLTRLLLQRAMENRTELVQRLIGAATAPATYGGRGEAAATATPLRINQRV